MMYVSLEDETIVAYQSIDEKTPFGKSLITEAGLQLIYLRFPIYSSPAWEVAGGEMPPRTRRRYFYTRTTPIYRIWAQGIRWEAAFSGDEWSIPMFRAEIPHFTSKIVEHSRHLPYTW